MHRIHLPLLKAAAIAAGIACFLPVGGHAQQSSASDFKISKIEIAFAASPGYGGSGYDKRVQRPGQWLEVEAIFDWLPRTPEPKYLDDLTVNYYVLLNNKGRLKDSPEGTLLTGTVNHTSVAIGKDLKSVIYLPPRALERLFDGKIPGTAKAAVAGVGVTLTQGGQVVAELTTSGKGQWWAQMKGVSGYLLAKPDTPFAPLAWDYFEPVKKGSSN